MELILTSLYDALDKLKMNHYGHTGRRSFPLWAIRAEKAAAYQYNEFLHYGLEDIDNITWEDWEQRERPYFPQYIRELAQSMPNSNWSGSRFTDDVPYYNEVLIRYRKNLVNLKRVIEYRKKGVMVTIKKEVAENIAYLESEANKFAAAMNLSNIINNTCIHSINGFRGKTVEKNISELDDDELLSFYGEITVAENDVREMLESVNHFHYDYRDDLCSAANARVAEWYKRNALLASQYVFYSLERTEITLKVIKELDHRDLFYGDKLFNEILIDKGVT
jgi:hypothetical protein